MCGSCSRLSASFLTAPPSFEPTHVARHERLSQHADRMLLRRHILDRFWSAGAGVQLAAVCEREPRRTDNSLFLHPWPQPRQLLLLLCVHAPLSRRTRLWPLWKKHAGESPADVDEVRRKCWSPVAAMNAPSFLFCLSTRVSQSVLTFHFGRRPPRTKHIHVCLSAQSMSCSALTSDSR